MKLYVVSLIAYPGVQLTTLYRLTGRNPRYCNVYASAHTLMKNWTIASTYTMA